MTLGPTTSFLIPVRIDSNDRIKNSIVSISHLLEKTNGSVIVKEVDEQPKFDKFVIKKIKEYGISTEKLFYEFEKSEDPVFYRMKVINEMLAIADTDIVVNYDIDVLLWPSTINTAISHIVSEDADVVYPYGIPNYQIKLNLTNMEAENFIKSDFNFKLLHDNPNTELNQSSFSGHVQFFNRLSYIEGGMENENFKGSSPDDFERLYRFTKLGYKVVRLNDYVYHIEHYRGNNSYPVSIFGNPFYNQNVELWEYIQTLSTEELREYYKKQEYMKKYGC